MIVHNLSTSNTILNKFVAEIRNIDKQKDAMRFRKNIERIGEILSYELSKELTYKNQTITTPLGKKTISLVDEKMVLCSILRAGLPLHQGVLNYFDDIENAFISAYRYHPDNNEKFEIAVEYLASPSLNDKTLIIADPMLATGLSMINVIEALKSHGTPKQLHIVAVIGAKQGIEYITKQLPENTHLWIATIDDKLNNKGYIVPGLGDAGDLAFGSKL